MSRRKEITAAEKKKLKAILLESSKTVENADAEYVMEKTPGILDKLDRSALEWIRLLAQRARLLYWLIVDWWNGDYRPSWRVVATAVAALLYLISPFDLIPDFIPIIGWLDDAAVLAIAFSLLNEELMRYARKMKIDPEEFDLVLI
ncbi:MAG: DUF1232 domain-containing protein [Planctomycetes bacterium]|nr:DUF1232 domain-containing protein [Planctomycetota bacterium]